MWIEIEPPFAELLQIKVTPLAGVWIEIKLPLIVFGLLSVTPLAGVWIEITPVFSIARSTVSLPLRECGLK